MIQDILYVLYYNFLFIFLSLNKISRLFHLQIVHLYRFNRLEIHIKKRKSYLKDMRYKNDKKFNTFMRKIKLYLGLKVYLYLLQIFI